MRLCFLCSEYPPGPHGGVGTMVQLLARALVQAGHQVRVAGVYPMTYPAEDYEEDQGVRVWRLRQPKKRLGWIFARYRLFRLIQRWAQAGEIELVEAPDSRGWFAGWPKLPVPLVQRAHGSYSYFARDLGIRVNRLTYFLEKRSYIRSDGWTSVSRYTADATQEVFSLSQSASTTLYNAIEPRGVVSTFADRAVDRVVYTGTLVRKKGIISLLSAWPLVKSQRPQATLDVYGKDGRTPQGESMIAFLLRDILPSHIHDSVTFHGHVSRETIYAALSQARVAVFPSYSEAFAFAPLEAMAVGCPTIYSVLGSGPELIRDRQDGLLVNPDDISEIARALTAVLSDDQLAKQLSENGRLRAQAFTVPSLLPANEAFFAQMIQQHAR